MIAPFLAASPHHPVSYHSHLMVHFLAEPVDQAKYLLSGDAWYLVIDCGFVIAIL